MSANEQMPELASPNETLKGVLMRANEQMPELAAPNETFRGFRIVYVCALIRLNFVF